MRIASVEALARLLAERLAESGEPGRPVTVAQVVERILPYPLVRERLGLAGKAEYDLALLRLLSDRVLLQLDPALQEAAARELDQPEPDLRPLDELSESLLRVRDPGRAGGAGPEAIGTEEEGGRERETAAVPEAAVETADGPAGDGPSVPEPAGIDEAGLARESDEGGAAPGGATPPPETSAPEPLERPPTEPPAEEAERAPTGEAAASDVPQPEGLGVRRPPPLPTEPPPGMTCRSCDAPLPAREGVRFCPHCGVDQQAARCTSCGERLEPDWSFCPRCGRGPGRP